jgi:transmembrane sensor
MPRMEAARRNMDNLAMSSEQIETAAAEWFWKRDAAGWTGEDEARFQAWLASATAHRIAYLRLSAAWKQAARMEALGAGVPTGVIPARGSWGNVRFPSGGVERARSVEPAMKFPAASVRRAGRVAVAASAVVAVVGALYLLGPTVFSGDRYSTPVGGLDTVPLADGSQVTLNTDTRIRVALGESERRIELDRGEAYFDVAKDPSRPFVVLVEDKRITAVGTRFSVRREGDEVRVAVTEGKVRIEHAAGSTGVGVQEIEAADPVLLAAGAVAQTAKAGVRVQSDAGPKAEQLLSWRKGYVVFDETPLAEAVSEFNRYNERRILVRDEALARLPIGGNFRSNNLDGFLWLLETGFPIDVQRDGDDIVLLPRRKDAAPPLQ